MRIKCWRTVLFILILCMLCCFSLSGCSDQRKQLMGSKRSIPFAVQYIKISGSPDERIVYPQISVIQSTDELPDYITSHSNRYDSYGTGNGSSISFEDAIIKYDDLYFQNSTLIIVLLSESSGSYRHEVSGIDKEGTIIIKRISSSDVVTMDLAEWCLLIELEKQYADMDFNTEILDVTRPYEMK